MSVPVCPIFVKGEDVTPADALPGCPRHHSWARPFKVERVFANWTFDNLNRVTASPGLTYSNDIWGNRLSNSASTNGWDLLTRITSFTSGSVTTNYSCRAEINGSYTCDDLNMLVKVGSGNYSNDVLGDRQSDPSGATYAWDQRSRLTSYTSGSTTTSYSYRADGMRVQKSDNSGGSTSYDYDGQMGFEDAEVGGSNPGVTDYAIGARGIDRIAFTSTSGTTVAYPILDGHGNMMATLAESGSSYSTGNSRSFDAWGSVINGSSSGDPKGRYCANLGHKQDDESGLVYIGRDMKTLLQGGLSARTRTCRAAICLRTLTKTQSL